MSLQEEDEPTIKFSTGLPMLSTSISSMGPPVASRRHTYQPDASVPLLRTSGLHDLHHQISQSPVHTWRTSAFLAKGGTSPSSEDPRRVWGLPSASHDALYEDDLTNSTVATESESETDGGDASALQVMSTPRAGFLHFRRRSSSRSFTSAVDRTAKPKQRQNSTYSISSSENNFVTPAGPSSQISSPYSAFPLYSALRTSFNRRMTPTSASSTSSSSNLHQSLPSPSTNFEGPTIVTLQDHVRHNRTIRARPHETSGIPASKDDRTPSSSGTTMDPGSNHPARRNAGTVNDNVISDALEALGGHYGKEDSNADDEPVYPSEHKTLQGADVSRTSLSLSLASTVSIQSAWSADSQPQRSKLKTRSRLKTLKKRPPATILNFNNNLERGGLPPAESGDSDAETVLSIVGSSWTERNHISKGSQIGKKPASSLDRKRSSILGHREAVEQPIEKSKKVRRPLSFSSILSRSTAPSEESNSRILSSKEAPDTRTGITLSTSAQNATITQTVIDKFAQVETQQRRILHRTSKSGSNIPTAKSLLGRLRKFT